MPPAPVLSRTHLASHDLDWLPPRYRAVRWGVAGVVWTGIIGGIGTLLVATKFHAVFYGKGLAALVAGGYVAGDRAARSILRQRLRRLATGAVDLSRLPAEPDGELVHVEGRIRARGTIASLVTQEPVVWRRVAFTLSDTRLIHESAVDFQLVSDGGGEPVHVDVAHARLLAPDVRSAAYDDDDRIARELEGLSLPESMSRALQRRVKQRQRGWTRRLRVRAAEICLRDGDRVEILGYKSRVVDPTVSARMERDTPMRVTLRGGKTLPLLIAPHP